MKKLTLTACSIIFLIASQNAFADMHDTKMDKMKNPVEHEYMEVMKRMDKPMMEGIKSKNPDVAFVKGMISHHQGAIEMARIQLKYGKDEQIRNLAENVIKAQEQEIKFMKNWLKENAGKKHK